MAGYTDADKRKGHGRKLTVPFVCRDGSQVSVTINPKLGSGSREEAIADAKEAVMQLAASFANDGGRRGAVPSDKPKDMEGDAVFRSWAFDQ